MVALSWSQNSQPPPSVRYCDRYHQWQVSRLTDICILSPQLSLTPQTGYDGSMLNGLQILPEWRNFFGHPTGSRLGSITNGVRYGQLGALFISAPLIQRLGRKKPIAIGSSILLVGVILQCAAQNYGTFVAGRFLIGFGNTIQTTACPILISELSHPSQRTQMVGIMNSTGSLGQLMAAWITFGTASIIGSWSWRLPSLLQVAPSAFQICVIWLLPESPRYLISKDRQEEALQVMAKYHANGNIHDEVIKFEFAEVKEALKEERTHSKGRYLDLINTCESSKNLSTSNF